MALEARALAAIPGPGGHARRQPDLEQAEQVAREQRQQHHHESQEQRLLELNAPADRAAAGLERDQPAGEDDEGEQDARRRSQESETNMAAARAAVVDDREQLQGQHRQHAGHDVQDQPAEQRQAQDRDQAEGRAVRTAAGVGVDLGRALHEAVAVDDGYGDRQAGRFQESRLVGRQLGDQAPPPLAVADLGCGEGDARVGLDEDVGRRPGLPGRGLDPEDLVRPARDRPHRHEVESRRLSRTRHLCYEAPDQVGRTRRRACRAGRQVQADIERGRDAKRAAHQEFRPAPQGDRLADALRHHIEREDHLFFVTEVVEAEELEALGCGPAESDFRDIRGLGPVHLRRQAGGARRAPVGLPALRQLDLETGRNPLQLADRRHRGQQARLDRFRPRPGPFLGAARFAPGQDRENGEQHECRMTAEFHHGAGSEPGRT